MAISDEYIGRHFQLFDASFKEFTGLRAIAEGLEESQRFYIYVCPSCLENRLVVHQNTLRWIGQFTKDHYPPQSVGGKKTILVCDKCNNTAGRDYDHILEKWLHWQAFSARVPNATLPLKRTTITNVTGYYGGNVTIGADGLVCIDVKGHKKPVAPLDKWMEHSKTNLNYSITTTFFESQPALIARALLKSAYLYAFKSFGYQFALSQHGQKLRGVIGGAGLYPIPSGYLVNEGGNMPIPEGLIYIQAPKEWQSLAVAIPLFVESIPYKRIVVVPIPAPTGTGWEDLVALTQWAGPGSAALTMTVLPLPVYLEGGELYGYTKAWEDCHKG